MNREQYNSDPRYAKVLETMDLLGIMDVTTTRQDKNGTIVWRLPIKNEWDKTLIEVASFSTGYVRNQNSGYSNYQLNKRCMGEPHYYPERKYNPDTNEHVKTGKYLKFETKGCVLIPIEIDRLEYLISYCLKNYFIKRANQVVDGEFVHKWKYEHDIDKAKCDTEAELLNTPEVNEEFISRSEHRKLMQEQYINGSRDYSRCKNPEVKVIINGQKYNVI